MPELKRVPQAGKMNLDFHERILPPGEYREALNVNIGRSETSEVGTVENLRGNELASSAGITGGTCIGSLRDNGNERIFFFVTSNDSFDESDSGEHGVFMFDQIARSTTRLVPTDALNLHKNSLITGINLVDDLLFWTDDRNEPRKINIDRAINDNSYYMTDRLMSVAKVAPVFPPSVLTATRQEDISSTFLEDKLPRFSYRWQFEDGEYSVLAPFSPIVFSNNIEDFSPAAFSDSGEAFGFVNQVNVVTLNVPITSDSGIVSVELLYKDTNSTTVYILEDKPVTSQSAVDFTYESKDPFRAIPGSQVTRVFDAVPRRAKSQEVAGGRIVYGNYLQNYNVPDVDFEVTLDDSEYNATGGPLSDHSVKSRRTYQLGIVLADEFGRQTPVILSNSGRDTLFVSSSDINTAKQINIKFPTTGQLRGFHSYRIVVKQREQEYYNWFTRTTTESGQTGLIRYGDSASKVPIDQTSLVEGVDTPRRPSSRSVYSNDSLQSVSVDMSGNAYVNGAATVPPNNFYEVEPVTSELDIFYETSTGGLVDLIDQEHGEDVFFPVNFFNCYLVGLSAGGFIEANRIRMGFNEPFFDVGVRAHIVNEDFAGEERRFNTLIHSSGFFNSRTGVNQLNQFNEAEGGITVSLDPADGSIQKLYAEDTQLLIWQEDKVSRSPIDKDFIYSAEGGAVPVTSNTQYLGTIAPYAGEYGISKDPGSFAVYGTRKYFTDRNRGVVLRLSQDGLTEISQAGMSDFFRDALRTSNLIVGSFSEYHNQYNLTIIGDGYDGFADTNRGTASDGYFTIGFEEDTKGWVSFKSFRQESGLTLNNRYYTFSGGDLWEHNSETSLRNSFYGAAPAQSYINFIFNDSPSAVKDFKTIGYEGEEGWTCDYITTDIDTIGTPPPTEDLVTASLTIEYTQNSMLESAPNTIFSGERRQFLTEGDVARWIIIVSPVSPQYVLNLDTQVDLDIEGGSMKSLSNNSIYFLVERTVGSSDIDLVGTLSGPGASLAFTLDLIAVSIVDEVDGATYDGGVTRRFNIAGDVPFPSTFIADEGKYLDETTVISVDVSELPEGSTFSQVNSGVADAIVTVDTILPSEPFGTAVVTYSGTAKDSPTLTWVDSVTSTGPITLDLVEPQNGSDSYFVPPRSNDSERTRTVTSTLNQPSSQVYVSEPVGTIADPSTGNISIVGDISSVDVVFTIVSSIDLADTTTSYTINVEAEDAVMSIDDDSNVTKSYLGGVADKSVTHNMPIVVTEDQPRTTITSTTVGDVTTYEFSTPEIDVVGDSDSTTITIAAEYARLTDVEDITFDIEQLSKYFVTIDDGNVNPVSGTAGTYNVTKHVPIGDDIANFDATFPDGFSGVDGVSTTVGDYDQYPYVITIADTVAAGDYDIVFTATESTAINNTQTITITVEEEPEP